MGTPRVQPLSTRQPLSHSEDDFVVASASSPSQSHRAISKPSSSRQFFERGVLMSSLYWACQAFIQRIWSKLTLNFMMFQVGMICEMSTSPTLKPSSRPPLDHTIGHRRLRYVAALLSQRDLQRRFQPSDNKSNRVTRELLHPSTKSPIGTSGPCFSGLFLH